MAENRVPESLAALTVPVDQLKPYRRNPRQGDVETIAESLKRHGQYRPIVVNRRTDEVLAGNHTLQAAKRLGWTEIAATYVDVDEDQAARIVLVDNRANDVAGYDQRELLGILQELDDLDGTGYDMGAIGDLLAELGEEIERDGLTDPDEVPNPPDSANSKLGQAWQLGEHRLVCGDAADPAALEALMAGREVDLLLTDPPYGVSYVGGTKDELTIENDELVGQALREFLAGAFTAAADKMKLGAPAYIFHADTHRVEAQGAMEDAGLTMRQNLIWAKDRFTLGRQDYQWQHEPILYGWREGGAHSWHGAYDKGTLLDELQDPSEMSKDELVAAVTWMREQIETTVLREKRPSRSELHPTIKPTRLLERLIHNSSRYGEAVLDPFGGSGSTLIACERTARAAYLVELDPVYCDVIIARWEQHTGRKAEKTDG
jgi:site-specific DNA-methyltransferase (adenine-specific)